jgi:hypothetical protein
MDWVEKRAQHDQRMRTGVPRYWDYLKTAMEHAVNSYREHYGDGPFATGYEAQSPEFVHVMRNLKNGGTLETRTMVSVQFELSRKRILARYHDDELRTLPFVLTADGRVVLLDERRELDEEGASESFLARVLFPPETKP